ncbi:hypothetical protein ACEWY4_004057 [Coilia grayii]|uniref:G-protein coupled receptors family 1 profile domain-containing protein n=1 Tax=Coilia grayii TaxID=363190 RepID=A0ABD1KLE8_9TELE
MEDDLDYSDYYSSEQIQSFGLCDMKHLRDFGQKFLPMVYSVEATLGILANAALLFIFIRYTNIRKSPPLCMAISDLIFAATLPFFAVYATASSWSFGLSACKMITFLYTVTMYSSNFSLAFMTLEKYYTVVSVFCSVRVMGIPVRHFAAFSVWLFSVLASVPYVYFVDTHEHDGHQICTYHHVHEWRTAMKFEDIIVGFVVPFVIMFVCSVQLSYNITKTYPDRKCAVFKQHMAFVVAFFILWCPYIVVIFMHALQELHIWSDCTTNQNLHLAVQLTECLAFTHVFVNPVLYALQDKRIRRLFHTRTAEFLIESSEHTMAVELTAVHPATSAEGQ